MNVDKNIVSDKSLIINIIGDKVLRAKTKAITEFNDSLDQFVHQMLQCMYDNDGIGLAAPQVGISKKICVIDVTPCLSEGETCSFDGQNITDIKTVMPLFLINPTITEKSAETVVECEGCLSIPDFSAHVRRPIKVKVQFSDIKGEKHTIIADGILARCLQHEIDHLNGILYTDLISQKDKNRLTRYLAKLNQY